MTSSNTAELLKQAKYGNTKAIATLLNQSFRRENLTAIVERQEQALVIVLLGEVCPSPPIVTRVEKGLKKIRPAMTHEAVIYGQQKNDPSPQWSETITLVSPAPPQPVPSPTVNDKESWYHKKVRPRFLRLIAWEIGVLTVAIAPVLFFLIKTNGISTVAQMSPDLMARLARRGAMYGVGEGASLLGLTPLALMAFLLGIRPLALQEGTALFTDFRWRVPYRKTVIAHLVVLFVVAVVNGLVVQPIFSNTPVARWLLLGITQIGVYRVMLRLPSREYLSWWGTLGAVLFMEICTQLPLWLMNPIFNAFLYRVEIFRVFF